MVGGTQNHHQQQQLPAQMAPPQSSSSTAAAATTTPEEEEFLKRNTDCVYFLASPLTCKKGSECEYRHSDIARVNPRDCWYWINGGCLNPKCGFRHPPLDGLLGAEVPTAMGLSVPPLQTPAASAPHANPYGMPKQGVACIFFQKGFCLKGHLCPFLHGPPNSINNKPSQPGPLIEPPKMAFAGHEKPIQEPKFAQQANIQKPVEFQPPQGTQTPRTQAPPTARNGGAVNEKKAPPPSSMAVEEPPRYKPVSVVHPPVTNEISASRSNRGVYQTHHVSDNDSILNGKDGDEYSREPSPGFDVLVDNELGDSEYYHNEDQFGRSRGHDYDIGRSADYDVDQDMYREHHDYDHYNDRDRLQGGKYAWEDQRVSSERMLAGSAHVERKRYPRGDSPDQYDESDLRHRISKQRRGNDGLRSVVSREHSRDSHSDRMPRRDGHSHRDQGPLSSRLRGRIKIPGRLTSPGNENDLRADREVDVGRQHRSRHSPGRAPNAVSNQSRLRDRMKGRVGDDYNNEGRDYRSFRGRREMGSGNDSEFTGPKRLSELKSARTGESYEQQMNDRQSLGKRKFPRVESQQAEGDLSFEGPKPLSEILKRKRGGAETRALNSRVSSVNNEDNDSKATKDNQDNNEKERKEILSGSGVHANKEESNSVLAELEAAKLTGSTNNEKEKSVDGQSSLIRDTSEIENEEGLIDEDAMLDQELEAYDHREGDYDYEQMDGEDYNMDEGDNPDEEYLDEEDGDDYDKKENVVYS